MSLFRILVIAMFLFTVSEALAEPNTSPLQLQGPVPGGARSTLTESSGRMVFTVLNPGPTARLARVVVHFPESPNEQFSKDVWVPAQASASAAVTVGPAPNQRSEFGRLIQTVLLDRTDGADVVVLPPGTERLRTPSVLYRNREPSTSIVADLPSVEPGAADPGVDPDLLTLARVPRAAGLSEHLFLAADGPSPVDSEAFDGVDVVVIAGNRLKHDAPGRAALRHWVELGGRVWVMLDRVEPDTVAALFGDDGEMAFVDRTGLTTVRLRGAGELTDLVRELEQPVPFARVRLSESDRVIVSANEWPAAFVRRLGRGKVVFTTLGVAGWTRPKTARDGSGPFSGLKDFPIPLPQAILLTGELYPSAAADPLPPDTFAAILSEEIGYSVVGRGTAVAILGLFLLGLGGAGYAVRRSRNPVIVALAIPAVSAVAALAFVGLGENSRRAVPPTVALAGIVEPVPGCEESVFTGLYALYRPSSGEASFGTRHGSLLGFNSAGLDGQTRIRRDDDLEAWHIDGLALPAGTRTGSIRTVWKAGRVEAVARFGPVGIEGRARVGNFGYWQDAILSPRTREVTALMMTDDGRFTSGQVLPAGQFLSGAVLDDKQQRRQEILRALHTGSAPKNWDGRDFVFAWVAPTDAPLLNDPDTRIAGSLLLAVPLTLDRTAPNTPVRIPRGWIPYRRDSEVGRPLPMLMTAPYSASMRLRFQLPPSCWPLDVESAVLHLSIRAPFRSVTVMGAKANPLYRGGAVGEPLKIVLRGDDLPTPDETGGLTLTVTVGEASPGAASDTVWKIEALALEASGRTN